MTEKRGLFPNVLEWISFLTIALTGMALNSLDGVAIAIANHSAWVMYVCNINNASRVLGVFSGMLISGAIVRMLILIVMQALIEINADNTFEISAKSSVKLVVMRFFQAIVVLLIFVFIFRSSSYQRGMTETWPSLLSTALLIQILFAALGDSAKQMIFVLRRSIG